MLLRCRFPRVSGCLALCLVACLSASAQQFVAGTKVKINNTGLPPENFGKILGVADFNNDGRKDILGMYMETEYAVLLGQSDGSYSPVLPGIPVSGDGQFYDTVQVVDVNGDGRPDVVIVTSTTVSDHGGTNGVNTLNVYLGKGDGTFKRLPSVVIPPSTVIDAPLATLDLVADLNNDGKPDIVIDNTPFAPTFLQPGFLRSYSVFINQGGGVFTAGPSLPVPGLSELAEGDFNGDGFGDLVVPTQSGMQIYLNSGGTGFTAGATYPIDEASVAVLDLNKDHKLDLVAFDSGLNPSKHSGHILLGKGDGTFTMGSSFPYFPGPATNDSLQVVSPGPAVVADINGDGIADVALRILVEDNGSLFSNLQVYPGKGDGTVGFPSEFHIDTGLTYPGKPPALVDLKNDGKLSLLIAEFAPEFLPSEGYAIAANDGKGFFKAPHESPTYLPSSICTADFNKDGKDDVAVVSDAKAQFGAGSVVVYTGSGKRYFNTPTTYPIGMPSGAIAAGDVNGDGIVDLVVARSALYLSGLNNPGTTDLSVLLGNGDGTFQPAMNFTVLGAPRALDTDNFVALADVNHDGKLDLIGDWGVALGKGDGSFAAPMALPPVIKGVSQMAVGDINGDGIPDLAVGSATANADPATLYTLLGNGTGSFAVSSQQAFANTNLVGPVSLADMNGDGKLDLVYVAYLSTGDLHAQLGNGDGTFAAATDYDIQQREGNPFFSMLIADFNRDGKPDVLLLEPFAGGVNTSAGGDLTLLPGIGGGVLSATPQFYPLTLNQGVVLSLDKDAAPDVAGTFFTGVTRLINTGSKAVVTQ